MMYGTMDGMPVRITAGSAVQRRPEYLNNDPLMGPSSDSILAEQAMMMPTEDTFIPSDVMTVSAVPAEGKKDSNFARLFGVSLLVLGIALAFRK